MIPKTKNPEAYLTCYLLSLAHHWLDRSVPYNGRTVLSILCVIFRQHYQLTVQYSHCLPGSQLHMSFPFLKRFPSHGVLEHCGAVTECCPTLIQRNWKFLDLHHSLAFSFLKVHFKSRPDFQPSQIINLALANP